MDAYGRLCTWFYELDKPTAPHEELAFYQGVLEGEGECLELMCGSGRFLIPLAKGGAALVGTDASSAMLDVCRRKLRDHNLSVETRLEKVEDLGEVGRYSVVIIPAGSMDLITDESVQLGVLSKIRRALRRGGRLVFDGSAKRNTADWEGTWGGRWVPTPDGGKLVISWLSKYHAATGIIESIHRYEHLVGGRVIDCEVEDFCLLTTDRERRDELLSKAGFDSVQHWKQHTHVAADGSEAEVVYDATSSE